MARKISTLPELTSGSLSAADYLPIIDADAITSNQNKRVTLSSMNTYFGGIQNIDDNAAGITVSGNITMSNTGVDIAGDNSSNITVSASAIGIGHGNTAGDLAVAIGIDNCSGELCTTVGNNNSILGIASTGMGSYITVCGAYSVGMGTNINIWGGSTVGIGNTVGASGTAVAIGSNSYAGTKCVTITPDSTFTSLIYTDNVTIGYNAGCALGESVALGSEAVAWDAYGVTIGHQAECYGHGVTIGYQSSSTASNSVAIGSRASTRDGDAIAIGYNSDASMGGIAIGYQAAANENECVIGNTGITRLNGSITTVNDLSVNGNSSVNDLCLNSLIFRNGIVISNDAAPINTNTVNGGAVAIGAGIYSAGLDSVVIGVTASGANSSVAIGAGAEANGENSIAIGDQVTVTSAHECRIGNNLVTDAYFGNGDATVHAVNVPEVTKTFGKVGVGEMLLSNEAPTVTFSGNQINIEYENAFTDSDYDVQVTCKGSSPYIVMIDAQRAIDISLCAYNMNGTDHSMVTGEYINVNCIRPNITV